MATCLLRSCVSAPDLAYAVEYGRSFCRRAGVPGVEFTFPQSFLDTDGGAYYLYVGASGASLTAGRRSSLALVRGEVASRRRLLSLLSSLRWFRIDGGAERGTRVPAFEDTLMHCIICRLCRLLLTAESAAVRCLSSKHPHDRRARCHSPAHPARVCLLLAAIRRVQSSERRYHSPPTPTPRSDTQLHGHRRRRPH